MFGRKRDERAWVSSQRVLALAGVGPLPDRPTLAVVCDVRQYARRLIPASGFLC